MPAAPSLAAAICSTMPPIAAVCRAEPIARLLALPSWRHARHHESPGCTARTGERGASSRTRRRRQVCARGGAPRGENSGFFLFFTRIFHARRRRSTPRASDASCVSAVERPRVRLPCRPPGRLRAGAPLQPASWPHRLSSLLSKLFPFIRAAAVGRSRPAESSTSLFDWASRAPQALRK